MPNFLVIGAQKAGTTALHYFLKQHPDIYMSPEKEPHFFSFEGKTSQNPGIVTNLECYQALFDDCKHEKVLGEVSPSYMSNLEALKGIKSYIPEVKLIAMLRNPADRAYSQFLHEVREGREAITDFGEALKNHDRIEKRDREQGIKRGPWCYYKPQGYYYNHLKPYFDTFGASQLKVCIYEDFAEDPVTVLQEMFLFLKVDHTFVPNVAMIFQKTGYPKIRLLSTILDSKKSHPVKYMLKSIIPSKQLHFFLGMKLRNWNLVKPPLSSDIRAKLLEDYREDILQLQNLIQRDLSKWFLGI